MFYGENDIDTTVQALEAGEQPAVSVSLNQLKKLEYGTTVTVKRISRFPLKATDALATEDPWSSAQAAARLTPELIKTSPYDIHKFFTDTPPYQAGDRTVPKRDFYEQLTPVELVDWLPYITTAFLQMDPAVFLEYMRLILSVKNNPYVKPKYNASSGIFRWIDTRTGEEYSDKEIPFVMYPHTIREQDGRIIRDFSITLDRFQETIIWYALGESFTILDITRTNDPKFLEWAFSRVVNRSRYIKAQVNETSIVKIFKEGSPVKTYEVSLPAPVRDMFNRACDDVLALIRPQQDKLAARTIEVKALEAAGVKAEFVGPVWLNPLQPSTGAQQAIEDELLSPVRQLHTSPVASQFTALPKVSTKALPKVLTDVPSKPVNILPVAVAAAIGVYAMTR